MYERPFNLAFQILGSDLVISSLSDLYVAISRDQARNTPSNPSCEPDLISPPTPASCMQGRFSDLELRPSLEPHDFLALAEPQVLESERNNLEAPVETQLTLLVMNDVNKSLSLSRNTMVRYAPSGGVGPCDLFWPMSSEQKCSTISRPEYFPRDFFPLLQ